MHIDLLSEVQAHRDILHLILTKYPVDGITSDSLAAVIKGQIESRRHDSLIQIENLDPGFAALLGDLRVSSPKKA